MGQTVSINAVARPSLDALQREPIALGRIRWRLADGSTGRGDWVPLATAREAAREIRACTMAVVPRVEAAFAG